MCVARLMIRADGTGVADDVIARFGLRAEVTGVGQGEVTGRGPRRSIQICQEFSRIICDSERAIVEQRDLAVGMTQDLQCGHRTIELSRHDRAQFQISCVAQLAQHINDAGVIHRRAFEVSAIRKDLLGQLFTQQIDSDRKPPLGIRSVEATADHRQGRGIFEKMVAQQMGLEMSQQPFSLPINARPDMREFGAIEQAHQFISRSEVGYGSQPSLPRCRDMTSDPVIDDR